MNLEPPDTYTPERSPVPWRALEGLGIQAITFGILALTLLLVTLATKNDDALSVIGTIVNSISLGIVTILWIRRRHDAAVRDLGLRDMTASNVGVGIATGILGIVVAYPVAALVIALIRQVSKSDVGDPCQLKFTARPSELLLVFIGLAVVVLAPIAEEIFFRGFLLPAFDKWASSIASALITSLLFGLAHLDPLLYAPTFVLGLVLAWITRRRGSIVPSITAHMTFNAYGFALIVPQLLSDRPPC
ncbi:MAG TPA: CPBP family intramembrane glutamic endopeptidase [Actinomycetota bacterium]|nr:CPBP family intramembrane glutamic endopeptidase [Actinomycetota bacterium]